MRISPLLLTTTTAFGTSSNTKAAATTFGVVDKILATSSAVPQQDSFTVNPNIISARTEETLQTTTTPLETVVALGQQQPSSSPTQPTSTPSFNTFYGMSPGWQLGTLSFLSGVTDRFFLED
jgi:hypothetical protein